MVVILESAAAVFWMEYRRFIRTRRYWVFLLAILIVCSLFTLGVGALARFAPQFAAKLFGLSYLAVVLLGFLAGMPSLLTQPLVTRMLMDVYKTHMLTDLYLTELHPLGVLMGRALATAALTGVSLLTLTPHALWLCALIGVPATAWLLGAPLALASYLLITGAEAFARRANHPSSPKSEAELLKGLLTAQSFTLLIPLLAWVLLGLGALFLSETTSLERLPLWAFSPYTAPLLGLYGGLTPIALGLMFVLGFSALTLLAAAQWRDWWSETAYRVMRWGGTALWVALMGVSAGYLAGAFVGTSAGAERFLLLMTVLTALINLSVASLLGYFGMARRPKPPRLPYPLSGLVWQWALQWLTAVALYLAVGYATGYWVALERWLLWATLAWAGITLLSQAMFSVHWSFLWRAPSPLQGDYYCGWLINTHAWRVNSDNNSVLAAKGAQSLLGWLGIFVAASLGLRLIASTSAWLTPLAWLADWLPRLHPWWGFYREWMGMGNNWWYVPYALAWVIGIAIWRVRRGLRLAERMHAKFREQQALR